jgi:uncharacterized membrane protein
VPQSKKSQPTPNAFVSELDECVKASFKHRMDAILDSLPPTERDALLSVLSRMRDKNRSVVTRANSNYSYKWLAEVLTKHGHEIKANQVRHYLTNIYPKTVEGA